MNSFIKDQMILFDYSQKNNWFLDLNEEVENNHLKDSPLPLDDIWWMIFYLMKQIFIHFYPKVANNNQIKKIFFI